MTLLSCTIADLIALGVLAVIVTLGVCATRQAMDAEREALRVDPDALGNCVGGEW